MIKGYENVRNMRMRHLDGDKHKTYKRRNYWLIRTFKGREILGMVWTVSNHPGLSAEIVKYINTEIGNTKVDMWLGTTWFFDEISQAEFETYQAFDFKEVVLQYE